MTSLPSSHPVLPNLSQSNVAWLLLYCSSSTAQGEKGFTVQAWLRQKNERKVLWWRNEEGDTKFTGQKKHQGHEMQKIVKHTLLQWPYNNQSSYCKDCVFIEIGMVREGNKGRSRRHWAVEDAVRLLVCACVSVLPRWCFNNIDLVTAPHCLCKALPQYRAAFWTCTVATGFWFSGILCIYLIYLIFILLIWYSLVLFDLIFLYISWLQIWKKILSSFHQILQLFM